MYWIFEAIFDAIEFVITLIPTGVIYLPEVDFSILTTLLSYSFAIFPKELALAIVGNIVLWMSVTFGWTLIEWVYKKIPGVT